MEALFCNGGVEAARKRQGLRIIAMTLAVETDIIIELFLQILCIKKNPIPKLFWTGAETKSEIIII